MAFILTTLLTGLSYGLLLFMLSAGLTLIFGLMGVLNFAHAAFYMLGAYLGYTVAGRIGFWGALVVAPLAVGVLGALFERCCLRQVHRHGQVAELLATFGLAYVTLEAVQLLWGRAPLAFAPPAALQGAAFTLVSDTSGLRGFWGEAPAAVCQAALCAPFPAMRALTMLVALLMLAGMGLLRWRTRLGSLIEAARTHPAMTQALGHDVPHLLMGVFGAGAGLAALAGVIGGSAFVTEPAMANSVGPIIFVVVVVGGLGSLAGAFAASLLIGLAQTFAVALDVPLGPITLSRLAPLLPYALMVLMLCARPRGLFGTRDF